MSRVNKKIVLYSVLLRKLHVFSEEEYNKILNLEKKMSEKKVT